MNLAIGKCVNINGNIVKPIISNNCENCALIPCDEARKLYDIKYCFIGMFRENSLLYLGGR